MSKLVEYTFKIFKADKRYADGRRLVEVKEFAPSTKAFIESAADTIRKDGFIVEVYETFVTRKNLMSGKEFKERYDTPWHCSPASESFWSN